jgi:hypothetical protein
MQLDTWFIIEGFHEYELEYIYESNLTKLSQWRQTQPDIEISFKYEKEQFRIHSYNVSHISNDFKGDHD